MENKQLNLSEPENIMGTMDVNPLPLKLSIHIDTLSTQSIERVLRLHKSLISFPPVLGAHHRRVKLRVLQFDFPLIIPNQIPNDS